MSKALSLIRTVLRCNREPDEVIGRGDGDTASYLRRWHVIPHARDRQHWWFFKRGNIFLHHFNRSDEDRALHDHPWRNVSILLDGSYIEHQPGGVRKLRRAGAIVFRNATIAHRVELLKDASGNEKPVWTIFITGPKVRDWGFWCPKGWKRWQDFCDPVNPNQIGSGCGE